MKIGGARYSAGTMRNMTAAEDVLRLDLDLDALLRLRLVIARLGEMDGAGWWNTRGVLGANGAFVFRRTFLQTHAFAQARVTFAVARSRCQEVFAPPNCATLWHLPAEIEDQFEDRWQDWLDQAETWQPFFDNLAALTGGAVIAALQQFDLIGTAEVAAVHRLSISSEGRSVLLPPSPTVDDGGLCMLAAAFSLAKPGKLVVPYMPLT